MGKISFGGQQYQQETENNETTQVFDNEDSTFNNSSDDETSASFSIDSNDNSKDNNYGASQTQPNGRIATPQIIDQSVPIVVFVGPSSSGKSMILVRLAKFLRASGYTVKADTTFLNTPKYLEDCNAFEKSLNTNIALPGTVKFLLVNVFLRGTLVCKLLEAPGEDFYSTDINKNDNNIVKPYLSTIMTSRNRKSYVVLLDLDSDISFRRDSYHRESYTQRFLTHFYPAIDVKRDRIVLLYNKIDITPFGSINGCNNPKGARREAEIFYRDLFANLKVTALGGFFTSDNFVFLPFCTGTFSPQQDDRGNTYKTYNVASDCYPESLWKSIISRWK